MEGLKGVLLHYLHFPCTIKQAAVSDPSIDLRLNCCTVGTTKGVVMTRLAACPPHSIIKSQQHRAVVQIILFNDSI